MLSQAMLMDDLPPPIKVSVSSPSTENQQPVSSGNKSEDEPLIKHEFRINNPFSKFFSWVKEFLKKQSSVTIKIPLIGIMLTLSGFGVGLGSGYNWGIASTLSKFFPDSSPVLHRAILLEGTIQRSSSTKYYLKSGDNSLWTLKSVNPAINLADYTEKAVKVAGNLTTEKLVIEVSEIIPLETRSSETTLAPPTLIQAKEVGPSVDVALPELFSGFEWEKTQKKVLIFTSGKRKIEQEGIYLESAQVASFPQEFINYYIQKLHDSGFKETLNSIDPDGITITYAKDDLFLTFGTKNIYSGSAPIKSGSGERKKLTGYSAFIEHN